jgi:hypothetical protein
MSNTAQRFRHLSISAAICCAIGGTLLTAPARADNEGLWMQQFYELRQINCARRWRDQAGCPSISMVGCIGFSQAIPYAAKAALTDDKKHGFGVLAQFEEFKWTTT